MNKGLFALTSVLVGATMSISEAATTSRPIMVGTTTDVLNVRSGPSVSYKVITKIKKGGTVEVFSKNSNGWYKVKYSGKEGWVNGKYVKEKFVSSSPTRYVSGTRREVLRGKAATGGTTYGYIYEGESVKVIDYSGSYARVLYKGKVYYMSKQYLQKTHKSETMYVSGKSKTNLMEMASSASSVKGSILEGTAVSVVGKKGSYYHVKYNNKWYYVSKSALSNTNPTSTGFVSGVEYAKVYSEDKKKVLGYIGKGQKIIRFTTSNGFTRIRWNGGTGLIDSKSVKFSTYVNKTVNANSVKVMSSQSNSSAKLGTFSKNEVVKVYEKFANWSKVKIGTKYGYVENKYLSEFKYSGVKKGTPLRSTKSTANNSNIILNIPLGEKLVVEDYSEGWAKVKYKNKTGYVVNENLVSKAPVKEETQKPIGKVSIKDTDVWIRKTPEWSGEKVVTVKKGQEVELYEKGSSWSKVGYKGSIGYVGNDYLDFVEPIGKVSIKDTDVWIRKTPEWSGEKVVTVKKGQEVELYEKGSSWSKVGYKGSIGYVGNDYLDFVDDPKPPTDSSEDNESSSGEIGYLETIKIVNPTVNTRYVINEGAKVYRDSNRSELIGYLRKGATIEEIESDSRDSAKCKVNNSVTGYIGKEEISYRNPFVYNRESFVAKKVSKTHSEYIDSQSGKTYPSIEDITYYSNPKNISIENKDERYQFLKLNKFRNVNVYELNEYLNSIAPKDGKETVFKNQAQAFIDSARKNNIDPIYLVAHTMLETGYGFSQLAQGVTVNTDGSGNSITPTKVYNLYGIGAVDSDPIGGGSRVAYALGWTDIPKAIDGAAKWISVGVKANPSIGLKEGYGYINSSRFTYQYTLYSMRWDWNSGWHQYASDPQWALKISRLMNKLSYLYEGASLEFEKIEYKEEADSISEVSDETGEGNDEIISDQSDNGSENNFEDVMSNSSEMQDEEYEEGASLEGDLNVLA